MNGAPLKEANSLRQECSAAIDLLRVWGTVPVQAMVSQEVVRPVIEKYARGMWYRYGDTLFQHLSRAAQEKNIFVIPGPGNIADTLARFLYLTCSPANPVTKQELKGMFSEIADRVYRIYGAEVKYDHTLDGMKNIEKARLVEAGLWLESRRTQPKTA